MSVALQRFRGRPGRVGPVSLEQVRATFAPAGVRYPLPADVQVQQVDAGGTPAGWMTVPGSAADAAMLFLHGGAYRTGSLASHGELAARLGRAAGLPVLVPEYRLAPEDPYPAAIEDAQAAWRWLVGKAGYHPSRIVVAGDSAGGGLSLALLVAIRDQRAPLPSAAALMSPWTDLTCSGPSMSERAEQDPVLSPAAVRAFAAGYLAGADPHDPSASPLFADLTGLPPLLVQVGTAEILLSDAQRLAERAGVLVKLQVVDDLPHVFQAIRDAPEAEEAVEAIGCFFQTRLELVRP